MRNMHKFFKLSLILFLLSTLPGFANEIISYKKIDETFKKHGMIPTRLNLKDCKKDLLGKGIMVVKISKNNWNICILSKCLSRE